MLRFIQKHFDRYLKKRQPNITKKHGPSGKEREQALRLKKKVVSVETLHPAKELASLSTLLKMRWKESGNHFTKSWISCTKLAVCQGEAAAPLAHQIAHKESNSTISRPGFVFKASRRTHIFAFVSASSTEAKTWWTRKGDQRLNIWINLKVCCYL